MDVDVPMPGAAAVRTRIGGKGGEIALSATAGLYLDGDMRAAGGTPDAPGGKLSLRLETPLYDAGTPDEMIRPRELVVAQAGGASLLPVGARPDSVTLSYGQGRIGVDQILAGGFDEVSLMARDLVTFDGNVDLGLRRAINLYEGALGNTRAGATVRLAAPYVLLSGRTSLLPRRLRLCRYSPRWKNGGRQGRDAARLGVEADHIDIRDFVRTGIQGAVTLNGGMTQTVDRRGYGLVELRSRGDLRFLSSTAATPASLPFGGFPSAGAMLASGDLLLAAQRIYPATGSAGLAVAGVRDANTFDPERALRVQRVDGSCPPSRRCRRSAGWRSWRRRWSRAASCMRRWARYNWARLAPTSIAACGCCRAA